MEWSRNGIPREVVTDNGSQFSLQLFKYFGCSWGLEHSTINPTLITMKWNDRTINKNNTV